MRYDSDDEIDISKYVRHREDFIEYKINKYIRTYLKKHRKFIGYNVFDLTNKWTSLNKPTIDPKYPNDKYQNRTERSITIFDGLYIITNDLDYYPSFFENNMIRMTYKPNVELQQPKIKQFMVIEAEVNLTIDEITKKVEEMIKFLDYIKLMSYVTDSSNLTLEYIYQCKRMFINEFKREILLVFGSENMNEELTSYIKNNYESWYKNGINVSYTQFVGDHYEIYNKDKQFKPNNVKKVIYTLKDELL